MAMRRIIGTIGATLAMVAALATSTGLADAHSHRDHGNILKDPTADNVDTYAFTTNSGGGNVGTDDPYAFAAVVNWIPLADPAGGPNFFPLDEDARYAASGFDDLYEDKGTSVDIPPETHALYALDVFERSRTGEKADILAAAANSPDIFQIDDGSLAEQKL
jgi:hypothetical protein